MILLLGVWTFLRALLGRSTAVTVENIALRHQLMVLQRSIPHPRLRRRDRIFWVCLSRLWANWRPSLVIVKPATVIGWHRQGFRLYWLLEVPPMLTGSSADRPPDPVPDPTHGPRKPHLGPAPDPGRAPLPRL